MGAAVDVREGLMHRRRYDVPMNQEVRFAEVLLVEDDPDDIEFTRLAFRDSRILNELHVVQDGEDALRFLRNEPPHETAPRPDLIILDLGLPRMDGKEVLMEVKKDPDLRRIPVVVLTSSRAQEDVVRSYELGVNSYIQKPVTLEGIVNVIKDIEHYWLGVVVLPNRADTQ